MAQNKIHCFIYSAQTNTNAQKSLIAGQYGGNFEFEFPKEFKMGTDNKTPEFLKKNPNGQVPTMDTPDGPIWESNAMAKYVARKGHDKGLYGANEYQASVIDQWVEWVRSKIETQISDWLYPVFGYREANAEKREKSMKDVAAAIAILDGHLADKEWIVGTRVTLADILLFVSLSSPLKYVMDTEFLKPYPHVVAWAKRCLAQKEFHSVIGDFTFCEKELAPGALKR